MASGTQPTARRWWKDTSARRWTATGGAVDGRLHRSGSRDTARAQLPNFWIHASCDHSVAVRLTPNGLTHTSIRMIWLVDGKAEEGRDYDLEKLLPFWLLTAEQDWAICANQQRGVNSHAYTPARSPPTRNTTWIASCAGICRN